MNSPLLSWNHPKECWKILYLDVLQEEQPAVNEMLDTQKTTHQIIENRRWGEKMAIGNPRSAQEYKKKNTYSQEPDYAGSSI